MIQEAGNYYNFTNIRYGAPARLFEYPREPQMGPLVMNDGSVGKICPQGLPAWKNELSAVVQERTEEEIAQQIVYDERVDMDCLFLDIQVPRPIFDRAQKKGWKRANGSRFLSFPDGPPVTSGLSLAWWVMLKLSR